MLSLSMNAYCNIYDCSPTGIQSRDDGQLRSPHSFSLKHPLIYFRRSKCRGSYSWLAPYTHKHLCSCNIICPKFPWLASLQQDTSAAIYRMYRAHKYWALRRRVTIRNSPQCSSNYNSSCFLRVCMHPLGRKHTSGGSAVVLSITQFLLKFSISTGLICRSYLHQENWSFVSQALCQHTCSEPNGAKSFTDKYNDSSTKETAMSFQIGVFWWFMHLKN